MINNINQISTKRIFAANIVFTISKLMIMDLNLSKKQDNQSTQVQIYFIDQAEQLENNINKNELQYAIRSLKSKPHQPIIFNKGQEQIVLAKNIKGNTYKEIEQNRQLAAKVSTYVKQENSWNDFSITQLSKSDDSFLAFIEGFALTSYQFNKYKTAEKGLKQLNIPLITSIDSREISHLQNIIEAVYAARDLVNEPADFLTSVQLGKEIQNLGKKAGFSVDVLDKKKIEALKMGGLLAVNRGSVIPPTFSIMEWKPENAVNKKPVILVGKGVVYDTGGLNIKVSGMELMKSDMGGSAAVIGALYAIAKNKLPIHVVGLAPSTDNRLNGMAYAAGDVITMHSGKTVEVLNTDAEGRMLLADALSYAQKYDPEIVLDAATLTGSAARAIGQYGVVGMGTADKKQMDLLKKSGNEVYERIAEFPFWDEYNKLLESNVADLKNIGGPKAGAITAGKFLANFIDYPWIHLDIAGAAFLQEEETYKPKGGSGVGVRLFYQFIKNYIKI